MSTVLKFSVSDRPMDELWREREECCELRDMVEIYEDDRVARDERMEMLLDKQVMNSVDIFYQCHKAGVMEYFLSSKDDDRAARAMFADEIDRLKMQSRVCRLLADLDVQKIGASQRLANLYHELRLEVDRSKKEMDGAFLFSVRFWDLYFEFYDAYTTS